MKETIQANQIRMKLLAEEMTILKEEQQQPQESTQQQQQGLEQMKPEHLWHHIIKVGLIFYA
jgi:Uma2 family endonuclease